MGLNRELYMGSQPGPEISEKPNKLTGESLRTIPVTNKNPSFFCVNENSEFISRSVILNSGIRKSAIMDLKKMALIPVILALFFVSTTFAISDAPFIVAHKKVTLARQKSGVERVSVSIDIYNQGSATAYDVSLTDDKWAPDVFDSVSGNTSKSWEKLDAGSLVSHAFILESKVKGVYQAAPAIIKFRIPTKAALQEALSTPMLPLDILADRPPEKKFEWAKRLLGKYGSLVSVISIVVLFVYLVATPSKSTGGKASKKRR